ncbi:MAG: type VI secretion system contractile sheath large subunit, partial [Gammaproteobacteria bacterium]|nr:type VI secretion system contractile sheath large subunit [Gammaproteobacteria bacterium]
MAEAKKGKAEAQVAEATEDDFAALLQKEFKPKSDRAKEEVASAVQTLAEQVLEGEVLLGDDVVGTISAIIAEIDLKLTEQVNAII